MKIFDEIIDRRNTSSIKYDFMAEHGFPEDSMPFWVADMDFRTPQPVIDELVNRSRHGIFGYTDFKNDYRESVANWFRARHNWNPPKDFLTITPGVVFAICTAIRAFTNENDSILICPPVYHPFFFAIQNNHRNLVQSPLILKNDRYEMNFEDFEQKIRDNSVKMFILCSPHNPVGRVWTREELEKIGEICLRHGVLIIADEIHCDFIYKNFKHTAFASISDEFEKNSIVCTSPSKTFNLAGLQIANIFIADQKLHEKFVAELQRTGYGDPNTLGLFAAKSAYDFGSTWLDELLDYLSENIQRTRDFWKSELPSIKMTDIEGTYLLWLDFSKYNLPSEELDRILIHEGKLRFNSGKIFGIEGKNFQRVNIACPWKTLEIGLNRLSSCLKKFETR